MHFVACGDLLFSSSNLINRLEKRLIDELKTSDATFGNAEFTCPDPMKQFPAAGRLYITSVNESTLDEVADLNFSLVSFANNHSGDFGPEGVINTINAAEKRKIAPCGIGRSLEDALLPKFVDSPNGRIGCVATSTTRSEMMLASSAGARTLPRPGISPLRWGRAYVLPHAQYRQLQRIDESLGTAEAFRRCNEIEIKKPFEDGHFKFGSLFEGSLDIERGDHAYVRTYYNEEDAAALLKSVKDSKNRSDFNFVSVHTHEGMNNNWYNPIPAEFVQEFTRKCIDVGADAVVCHGAHFMRGVEIYKEKPIFYNLGSFLMEFEVGESLISPEMYNCYGLPSHSRPSDLHMSRANDATGKFTGFNSSPVFSRNALAVIDTDADGKVHPKLLPLDLGMQRERKMDRGVPHVASPKVAEELAAYLTDASKEWGTKLTYNESTAYIEITA
ncbi:DEKNAAC103896 [Brettanomyces naardenensis]|uniref:DEKNAAC103896 n=1 Tax=Brettanomyces naardenensis TaxID=13370 RepID=A0A448YPG1_BRENA|nr:DEKNAAC103896 [Brettanomyces naardenensis]